MIGCDKFKAKDIERDKLKRRWEIDDIRQRGKGTDDDPFIKDWTPPGFSKNEFAIAKQV